MPWYLYALLFSLFFAVIPIKKRSIVHSEENVMFWSSGLAFFLIALLFPLLDFPMNEKFYFVGMVSGISGVIGGLLQIKLSSKNSGRVMPGKMLIQVFSCFVFYLILNHQYYEQILSNPVMHLLSGACVFLLIIISLFLRKTDFTVKSLLTVAPVSILFAFIVAYYKTLIQDIAYGVENAILVYIMAHYFTLFIAFSLKNLISESFVSINEKLITDSLQISIFYVFGYYFLFLAVHHVSNPAYALVFNLLIPVWIKLYSIVVKRKDDADLNLSLIALVLIGTIIIIV